jgi:acyl-coenzyme A thioesterase PaaI-like protein
MIDSDPPPGFVLTTTSAAFGQHVGPFYDRDLPDGGYVRAFRVRDVHANSLGIVHGGMLMTAADTVLARAARGRTDHPFVTLRLACDFVGPARIGDWVEGGGTVTRATRSLVFCRGELRVGRHLVLRADAVFRVLKSASSGVGPVTRKDHSNRS